MRVVVTGASGNVGTSLLRALAADPAVTSVLGLARRLPGIEVDKTTWAAADVAAELAAGTLTRIELVDAAPVRREIVAVRRRDAGPPSGAAGLFLEMLTTRPPV